MSGPVRRTGGRLLLLDPDGRVLLIHERLQVDGVSGTHWLTPGGGAEPGETPQQAAVREVYEETGLRVVLPDDAPEVCRGERSWSWRGVRYEQVDHVFAVDVPAGVSIRQTLPTADERALLLGHRWWSAEELAASAESFVPDGIAAAVVRLTAGPPATPRLAGRVLLIDADGRVLLQHCRVDVGAAETHWITPGGGADPGETAAQAAARELYEEHGVRALLAGEPVFTERKVFRFAGGRHDQTDHYFAWRVDSAVPLAPTELRPTEAATLLGARWWTLAELRSTGDVVHPHGLADLLERVLREQGASA